MEEITGIFQLQEWISNSDNIVFFGGAGVSTESGIPDFRSVDGLYNQKYKYPPEEIISHDFFFQNTKEFYLFYREKMLLLDKKPNPAHLFLTELEKSGKLKAIITQNIDGLHQKAGSENVYELHGTIHSNHCLKCHKYFDAEYIKSSDTIIPYCDECGGLIKPDVVLYGEGLYETLLMKSLKAIYDADLFIIAGTSLVVNPAASLVYYYRGNKMVLINKTENAIDKKANLVFHHPVGDLFRRLHL